MNQIAQLVGSGKLGKVIRIQLADAFNAVARREEPLFLRRNHLVSGAADAQAAYEANY